MEESLIVEESFVSTFKSLGLVLSSPIPLVLSSPIRIIVKIFNKILVL